MKRFVFASHHSMATGMKDTMEFLTKTQDPLYDISAYMNDQENEDLEAVIAELFDGFRSEDTVVIMTDMMNGSVNQKFYPYINDHVFLISGVNVPLALVLMLADEKMLTAEYVAGCVEQAKEHLVFINNWKSEADEDDE